MNKTPRNPGTKLDDRDTAGRFKAGRKGKAGPGRPSLRTQALKEARELIQAKAREIAERPSGSTPSGQTRQS